MKRIFQARTAGFYMGLSSCLAVLLGLVALILTDRGDITFSWVTVGLLAAGAGFGLIGCLSDLALLPLLAALGIGSGFSYHLYQGLPTLSDQWNGVNFIGGNPQAVTVFGTLFGVCTLLSLASCFLPQRKNIEVEGKTQEM